MGQSSFGAKGIATVETNKLAMEFLSDGVPSFRLPSAPKKKDLLRESGVCASTGVDHHWRAGVVTWEVTLVAQDRAQGDTHGHH